MSRVIVILMCAMLIVGCQMKVEPTIKSGIDQCENCSMVIQDVDQGAVAVDSEEETHTFCNPVCLIYKINELKEEGKAPGWQVFLFDHADNAPVSSRTAYLVHGDFSTAMGFGLLAFDSPEDADAFAKENGGEVIYWNDLRLMYESPDLEISLTSGDADDPEVFETKMGSLVEVSHRNNSSSQEQISLTGYDFVISIGPDSEGTGSLIADKPGQGFAFENSEGAIMGMLIVSGDHTSEEADYR